MCGGGPFCVVGRSRRPTSCAAELSPCATALSSWTSRLLWLSPPAACCLQTNRAARVSRHGHMIFHAAEQGAVVGAANTRRV